MDIAVPVAANKIARGNLKKLLPARTNKEDKEGNFIQMV